ncbi:hypothetical protein GCM10020219_104620 [Nonomuraea dietziae]
MNCQSGQSPRLPVDREGAWLSSGVAGWKGENFRDLLDRLTRVGVGVGVPQVCGTPRVHGGAVVPCPPRHRRDMAHLVLSD